MRRTISGFAQPPIFTWSATVFANARCGAATSRSSGAGPAGTVVVELGARAKAHALRHPRDLEQRDDGRRVEQSVYFRFVRLGPRASNEGSNMRRIIVGVLAVAVAVSLAASAEAGRIANRSQAPQAAALFAKVNVTASEFKFVLSAKTAKRGLVTFNVKNVGKLSHDFQISGRKTKLLSPGQSATLRVTFLRKGHYPYKCTVPGHAAAGMKGVFTIT
jgi:uncharacterized cupredoxin-like copper-binding protein